MEKLLWNTLGVLLFVANVFAFLFCALIGSTVWCISLFVVAILDVVYIRFRPTWLEV